MPSERKTRVFISYSRKDKRFARKLNDSLEKAGIEAWVDWEDIPFSADWMEEIAASIEGSDAFVFIISPDSIRSEVCARELDMAVTGNKKIIPVMYREIEKRKKMHPKLASTNWVQMRPKKEKFEQTFPLLINSVKTDLDWVKHHTRLQQRAAEWNQKNRNKIYLLQGTDLIDAEHWMADSTIHEDREVTPLQAEYITSSRKGATLRQRNLTIGIGMLTVFSFLLVIYAFNQTKIAQNNAEAAENSAANAAISEQFALTQEARAMESAQLALNNENQAKAQRSAAQANAYKERPGELDTSTLLALESLIRSPSHEAEDVLRHNISKMPIPVAQLKHNGRIWSITFSRDGQTMISSSADKTACVWTLQGEKKYCVQHNEDVTDALVTQDNSLLVTAGLDGSVRFWDFENGSPLEVFNYGSGILDIDINQANSLVVAGREDGLISVIDIDRRKNTYFYDFAVGSITVTKFQPNDQWLGIATREGYTRIWRLYSGTPEKGPNHNLEIFNLVFSPDGKLMVSVGEDSAARIARAETGRQTHVIKHNDWVEDVAFSPDSSWFATVSDDKLVRVIDAETGLEKLRMSHGGFVQRVEVSPNGNWLASTGYDSAVRIWDSHTGALMLDASIDGIGSALEFSPDGDHIIAGDRDGNITIWDITSLNARIGIIKFSEFVNQAKFNHGGEWILINADDKILWQIPADELTSIRDGTLGKNILSFPDLTAQIRISPNSKWIAISENSEVHKSRAILYNLETEILHSLPHDSDISGLAISPDDKFLATTNEGNPNVYIWNVESGESANNIPFDETAFTSSYSPRDPILAIGLTDKIILWDVIANEQIAIMRQIGEIRTLLFNHDGRWLASASSDGSINVWDMDQSDHSRPKHEFLQSGHINSLDFNSKTEWLASAGEDGFVHLWDLIDGQEIIRIPHGDTVSGIDFSPDGSLLSTVSRKTVQFWDVNLLAPIANDKLMETACTRLTRNFSQSQWEFFFKQDDYQILCPNLP
jgi:WD40 repeat protein